MTGLEKLVSMVTRRSGKSRKQKQSNSNRFVIYIRVSTKRQRESGLGLEAQRAAAQAYVAERGGEIIGEYREVETGRDCERPEILRALQHADRSFASVVIAKLDRLARSVWFCSTLLKSGIPFVCCDCPQASNLTIHILAAVAEQEAEMISCRTRDALAAYKARGGLLGPKTFKHIDKWREKQERSRQLATLKNAAVAATANEEVQMIALSLRCQGLSFQRIADTLNEQQYRTRTGRAWHKTTVKRLTDRASVHPSDNVVSVQD